MVSLGLISWDRWVFGLGLVRLVGDCSVSGDGVGSGCFYGFHRKWRFLYQIVLSYSTFVLGDFFVFCFGIRLYVLLVVSMSFHTSSR